MNSISPVNFKGWVPVMFFARNAADGRYRRITKKENVKKCQSFVVRNLNGTAKNMRNDAFVEYYESYDKEYSSVKKVKSVYDKDTPVVRMITGRDVDIANNLAKPIGKAKAQAKAATGKAKSFESQEACSGYYKNIDKFLSTDCKRITKNGKNLTLNVFFDPVYNKKNELKSFKYKSSMFMSDV